MNAPPPVVISDQSVTATGRVLQAPNAVLGASRPPRQAGMIRGGWGATIVLVLNAGVVTLQQWGGLSPWLYAIWVPILYAVIRQIEAEIDARSVAPP